MPSKSKGSSSGVPHPTRRVRTERILSPNQQLPLPPIATVYSDFVQQEGVVNEQRDHKQTSIIIIIIIITIFTIFIIISTSTRKEGTKEKRNKGNPNAENESLIKLTPVDGVAAAIIY